MTRENVGRELDVFINKAPHYCSPISTFAIPFDDGDITEADKSAVRLKPGFERKKVNGRAYALAHRDGRMVRFTVVDGGALGYNYSVLRG